MKKIWWDPNLNQKWNALDKEENELMKNRIPLLDKMKTKQSTEEENKEAQKMTEEINEIGRRKKEIEMKSPTNLDNLLKKAEKKLKK